MGAITSNAVELKWSAITHGKVLYHKIIILDKMSEIAQRLYLRFCEQLHGCGVAPVSRGRFGADMQVSLLNDGPVTLVIDTP